MQMFTAAGEAYFLPDDSAIALGRLVALIDDAQTTIRVIVYAFSHPAILAALVRAYKRGVDLKLILDLTQSQGVSETGPLHAFILATAAGIIRIGTSKFRHIVHTKALGVDGNVLLEGSTNWTVSAFLEDQTMMVLNAPGLVASFYANFDEEWQRISTTEPQYQMPGAIAA